MIWLFSLLGICLLFVCSYKNYKQDNNTGTIKNYFGDKTFRETAIEFIVVVLGVTIAINFADVLETKSTNAKMMELLQLGSAEVIASYNVNEDFLSKYQEGEIPIGEVKANAKAKTQSLENILSSEGVMVSICSTTYVGLSNQIELVNAFYSTLEKLDMDSEDIAVCVKAMDNAYEAMIFLIDNEIKHLNGKLSEKAVAQKYQDYFKANYVPIEE